MQNPKAAWALATALLALAVLAAAVLVARSFEEVGLYESLGAVPAGGLLALISLALARRARWEHQRTLGRAGGTRVAALARVLGTVALLIAVTAALALVVYAVLALALD
jgi:hypothetical protein